jgi:uncharacterized membrane protein (UPF0136 family)
MPLSAKLKSFIKSDWTVCFFLLAVFLCTNGYIYAWDDQHLEIPMLKGLIDSGLYQGDYYVESLKQNFPSHFYRVLAKLITVDQIPITYFTLYLISRYFLFFWIYKLWCLIARNKFSGLICAVTFIVLGRVEEFLYRTFSHQEFALAIIMAGIYFFYKERFVLSAAILGIAANIHAIYSAFVMLYMGLYLLIFIRRHGWRTLLKSSLTFLITALPVIILIIQKFINTHVPAGSEILNNWMELFKLACPQNFIFHEIPLETINDSWKIFITATQKYFVLIGLYLLNLIFHKEFRTDRKAQTIAVGSFIMLIISFIFTYIFPTRFVIDLNLIRNTQYLLFLLVGYTTIYVIKQTQQRGSGVALSAALFFTFIRFNDITTILAVFTFIVLQILGMILPKQSNFRKKAAVSVLASLILVGIYGLIYSLKTYGYSQSSHITLGSSCLLILLTAARLWFKREKTINTKLRKLLVIIPLVAISISYCLFHYKYVKIFETADGFWQMQRSWWDMQRYVKENTPKNALLLVPHDTEMGGFRILSERQIIVSYRDCGIIGFDYAAAVEWKKRMADIWNFKVLLKHSYEQDLLTALTKYRVNYIVFMAYAKPPDSVTELEEIYTNDVFSLYRVKPNPVRAKVNLFSLEEGVY